MIRTNEPATEQPPAHPRASWLARRLRLTSLRIRMIAVF
jgi:hypothetical protein